MNPLFLPEGSVRALIAISLTATFCVMVYEMKVIPEFFIATLGIVIGFYFGKRSGEKEVKP